MLYRDLVKNKAVDLDPDDIRYGVPTDSDKLAWGITWREQRPGDVPYYRPKPDSRWGRRVEAIPVSYPDLIAKTEKLLDLLGAPDGYSRRRSPERSAALPARVISLDPEVSDGK